nr:hypothetical protein BdHM001_35690 [Bdellovibrio sp. HM001]
MKGDELVFRVEGAFRTITDMSDGTLKAEKDVELDFLPANQFLDLHEALEIIKTELKLSGGWEIYSETKAVMNIIKDGCHHKLVVCYDVVAFEDLQEVNIYQEAAA